MQLWLRHSAGGMGDLQRKQGEIKHLQCCANVHNCQCLDDSNCPKEQHNLPAKEDKPDDIGYAGEGVNGVRPR